MVKSRFSPSVRLFEAAACAVPIISDRWEGIHEMFEPGKEILLADNHQDVMDYLQMDQAERTRIGIAGHERIMENHTSHCRARQLLDYVNEPAIVSTK